MKKTILILSALIVAVAVVAIIFLRPMTTETSTQKREPTETYVALGDSVAAGVGLKDASDSSACDRTKQAYPNEVAASLSMRLIHLACTGASSQVGILGAQDVNNLPTTQISELFALKKPDLISLTIGANDINWISIISKCYSGVCGDANDEATTSTAIATVSTSLSTILDRIQKQYPTKTPRTIVTGYYQVFPSTDKSCSSLAGVDSNERSWWRSQEDSLNETIANTLSNYSFARFASVNFDGHELCTDNSWVQGISDSGVYHPTIDGQRAIAQSVIDAAK